MKKFKEIFNKKKFLFIGCSSILIILIAILIIFLVRNVGKDKEIGNTTTTNTTELIETETSVILKDDKTNIEVIYTGKEESKETLEVLETEVSNDLKKFNVVRVYNIKLLDENNQELKSKDNLLIKIPFDNNTVYNSFSVIKIVDNQILNETEAYYDETNKLVYFYTNDFGTYGIVAKKVDDKEVTTTKKITTKTTVTTKNVHVNNSTNKKWKVDFVYDEGNIKSVEVKSGEKVKKPTISNSNNQKIFKYWVDLSTEKEFDFDTKIYKNYVLSAVYELISEENKIKNTTKPVTTGSTTTTKPKGDTVTVTFDTKGFGNISSQTVPKNSKVNRPNNPKATDLHFVEWQLNGVTFDFDQKITENITLTAKWEDLQWISCSLYDTTELTYNNGKYSYRFTCGKHTFSVPVWVEIYKRDSAGNRTLINTLPSGTNRIDTTLYANRGERYTIDYRIFTNVHGYNEYTHYINTAGIDAPTEELDKIDLTNMNYSVKIYKSGEEISSIPAGVNTFSTYKLEIHFTNTADVNKYYFGFGTNNRTKHFINQTSPIIINDNSTVYGSINIERFYKDGIRLCGANKLSNGVIYGSNDVNKCVILKNN